VVKTGARCDDGDPCTRHDVCQDDGSCAGTPRDCDDGVACTDDACDPAGGCVHTVRSGSCLIRGTCYADGDRHPDNPCRVCAAGQNQTAWSAAQQGTPCDDANPCTAEEACDGNGHCVAGVSVVCDPPGPCQEEGDCDSDTGTCTYALKQGTVCRPASDQCQEDAVCDGTSADCPENPIAVGRSCDDGNRCTTDDQCQSDGSCVGAAIECHDGFECTTDGACDPLFGCSHPLKPGYCLIDGACYADGDRNPANPCLRCDATPQVSGIWTSAPKGTACADGDHCNGEEACDGVGNCAAGVPVACDPPGPCQEEGVCDRDSGKCTYALKAQGAVCRPASDQCQDDAVCDGTSAECPANPIAVGRPCDDGNPCTVDDRCLNDGSCVGAHKDCDDGLECTDDFCGPFGCGHAPKPGFCLIDRACYADGERNPANPCQRCDATPQVNRIWTLAPPGTACADDRCNGEVCDEAGACVTGAPVECPACHACNPATGACDADPEQNGHACDTGSLCERDAFCADGVCRPSQIVFCGFPPNDCHLDGDCNPTTGTCDYPAKLDGTSCTTGDRCTTGETCQGGVCSGGHPVCDQTGPCLNGPGVCNPATGGCTYALKAEGSACDDGNLCTTDNVCQADGTCAGTPVACQQPTELCKQAVCNPETGGCVVTATPDGKPDRKGCETCLQCRSGACRFAPQPINCGGEDFPCLTCDPATGTCVPLPPNTDCGSTCDTRRKCDDRGNCNSTPAVGCVNVLDCDDWVCDTATGTCVRSGAKEGEFCGVDKCKVCISGICWPKCGVCQTCDPASGQCNDCERCCGGICDQVLCGADCCPPFATCVTDSDGNRVCCNGVACNGQCCAANQTCGIFGCTFR
jgi:hypothetical protein